MYSKRATRYTEAFNFNQCMAGCSDDTHRNSGISTAWFVLLGSTFVRATLQPCKCEHTSLEMRCLRGTSRMALPGETDKRQPLPAVAPSILKADLGTAGITRCESKSL